MPVIDGFDDTTMDPLLWEESVLSEPAFIGGTVDVEESGGTLRITPVTGNYNGYVSVPHYDLTASSVSVKALRGSDDDRSYIGLVVGIDEDNFYRLCAVGTYLQIDRRLSGSYAELLLNSSLTVELGLWQWWRIRGELGHLYADTSSDGLVWTNRYDWDSPFAFNDVLVALEGGQWHIDGPEAEVQFDNFAADAAGSEPEGFDIVGGSTVLPIDPPLIAEWVKLSVPPGQVGVSYEGESASGMARTFGVGWFSLLYEQDVEGGGVVSGCTDPTFVTHQSRLVRFHGPIIITAIITYTKIGVTYSMVFGSDA